MKLIITGATGFVGTEIVRQSLKNPNITSVVALARRPFSIPSDLEQGANPSKLQSVTVKDYDTYPEEVRKYFAGADACIWTVAITPSKSKNFDFEIVRRVCQDNTLAGLKAMFEARNSNSNINNGNPLSSSPSTPFRFMYMSGAATERDQSKTPRFMPQYSLMRGETENRTLAYAAEHKDALQVCVAKPGLIIAPGEYLRSIGAAAMNLMGIVPNLAVGEVSAAMLHQVVHGWEKEPLENADLVRIGRLALQGGAA